MWCSEVIPQTVLALRGSDGFSRDLWRVPGVIARSLGARSCFKNRYLGGRELKYTNTQWFLSTFVLACGMIARPPQMLRRSAVETGQMSSVETGQTSAVETGQMSAVETRQMSSDETRQMSSAARTDICLVSTHNVEVPEASTVAMSQCSNLRSVNCGNVTMFKTQRSQCSSLRSLNSSSRR